MKRTKNMARWVAVTILSVFMTASLVLSAFSSATGAFSFARARAAENVTKTETAGGTTTYIVNDTIRITPISDSVVRLEEKGPTEGFEDRETFYVLGRENFEEPQSESRLVGSEVEIATSTYRVRIPQNATTLAGAYVTNAEGVTLYKYNGVVLANTYLPSPSEDLRGWYFSDNPRIVPGENGYSVVDDGLELNGWDFTNEAPDVYVFVPENYQEFIEDYVTLTGKSNLVDLKTLGYWDSRWYIYNDELALQQILDYLDKGYSIDVIVIDTNWREGAVNEPGTTLPPDVGGMGYNVDKNLFPNMAEFLEKCHELGVNVIFNDHPEPVPGTTNGLDQEEIAYRSDNLKLILSMGLDMWWYDRNWSTALNSPDQDLSVFAWGMYAFQFIENEYYEEIADIREYARRAIIMGNVDGCENGYWKYGSDISAHRTTIQWTGDIGVDEAALQREIVNAVFGSAENGIPYVSADLGGHTASVTDDMYVRWLQFGALATITRVHCTHIAYCGQEGRMPWLFGDTAEEVTKEYVRMKYNLMPTLYSLAGQNANTGLPILRRLDVVYPQYAEASRNDEYLMGDGILMAPISEAYIKKDFEEGFFFHDDNGTIKNGLLGSYYANTGFSGTPVYTQADTNFVLDWGTASPKGLPNDNFSITWEGSFKVGAEDIKFSFFADDSVQVRIDGKVVVKSERYDTLYETDYYTAGTTHTIEIRYVEEGGNAHFYMYGQGRPGKGVSLCYDSREVFIPDGIWIDVWSGKEYQGPYTYTVTHPLETSPIFVRKGTLAVLAPNMTNLSEKDWSNLTLDAYPAASLATATLYEDDTTTQAYKIGKYRTTDITAEAVGGKYTITIGAAQGTFEGAKAFTTRTWNIRLHAFKELGAIKSITRDGKRVTGISYYTQDTGASPFAYAGAAADNAIYEFSFTGSVTKESKIVVEFTNNSALATFTQNADYEKNAASFNIGASLLTNNYINLDSANYDDWAFFGNTTSRKGGAERRIGDITSDFELFGGHKSAIQASWRNGDGVVRGDYVASGILGQVDENVALKVKKGETKVYTLYIVTEYAIGKLTVRDRAGNVQTMILDDANPALAKDGNLNNNLNGRTTRKVTITVSAEEDTEIYVRLSMHSSRKHSGRGTGSDARVGISAIVCGNAAAADTVSALEELNMVDASGNVDLTQSQDGTVVDWYKANDGQQNEVYMQGGEGIESVEFTAKKSFGDYNAGMSWTGGDPTATGNNNTNGFHTESNGRIVLTFKLTTPGKYNIVLYVGAWNSGNEVEVYTNDEKTGAASFSANNPSVCKKITIEVDVTEETIVEVIISSVGAHDDGNASLSAVQVVKKD